MSRTGETEPTSEGQQAESRARIDRSASVKRIALQAGVAAITFMTVLYASFGHKVDTPNAGHAQQDELGPAPMPEIPSEAEQQAILDTYNRDLMKEELKKAAVEEYVRRLVESCAEVTYFSEGSVTNYDIYAKQTSSKATTPIVVSYGDLGIVDINVPPRSDDTPYAVVSVQTDQSSGLAPNGCPVVSYGVELTESSDQIMHFTNKLGQDYTIPQVDIQQVDGLQGQVQTGILQPRYGADGWIAGLQSSSGEAVGILDPPIQPAFTG